MGALFGFGYGLTAHATDLAMARPLATKQLSSITSIKLDQPVRMSTFRDPQLICNLARLYATGQGVPKDEQKAFQLYLYAATNGIAEAQYAIALMYSDEQGPFNVEDAQQKALFWAEKAASQGYKQAEFTYQYLLNNTHYAGC